MESAGHRIFKSFARGSGSTAPLEPKHARSWYRSITTFLFGKDWVTASFWQDWYGIIPLLTGSILVSAVALLIAVPFGVSAAIYVSEVASPGREKPD